MSEGENSVKQKLLVVDDTELNRNILGEILGEDYELLEAENGQIALEIIEKERDEIKAILLDIVMPVMDGYEFLEKFRKLDGIQKKIPVIVISADSEAESIEKIYDSGAVDVIGRPFSNILVRKRIANIIDHYSYRNLLEEKVLEQTQTLRRALRTVKAQAEHLERRNNDIIEMLGTIVEFRNLESGEHIQRVKGYTRILAKKLAELYPEYLLDDARIEEIVSASALHDLGKVSIPDRILTKPGKLTKEEYEYMKSHTLRGCELLEAIHIDWDPKHKKTIYEIVRHHHERYDGKGYPDHLKEEEIPLSAQLVSLTDVYDALVSERCYKDAYDKNEAYYMILRGECGMFSPRIMEAFRQVKDEFEAFARANIQES